MGRLIVRADLSDDRNVRKDMITEGLESGICRFILRKEDADFENLGRFEAMYTDNGTFIDDSYAFINLDSPDSQKKALSMAGNKKAVIIRTSDWTVIPLENLIAGFSDSDTEIYACASSESDATLFLKILEKGVDGIVIDVDDPAKICRFCRSFGENQKESLSEVTVTSVVPIEMGDRVCIDTCSMMSPGEGMLIGSYSDCLFLVQSESEDNGYVTSRPFRVNAGAIHSYVNAPEGRTRYLSEFRSGDSILICDRNGDTRIASVGRCKIERRPLLMITATDGKGDYSIILQNAETVKLVCKNDAISVSKIKEGDRVLARIGSGGRHFGMTVDETISEK